VILARILLAYGQEEIGIEYLRAAVRYLDGLNEPRSLLCEGEKWQHWYRGETKMNLQHLQDTTQSLLRHFVGGTTVQ